MSIFTKKKPAAVHSHTAQLNAIAELDSDIGAAIAAAYKAGVHPYTAVAALERAENAGEIQDGSGFAVLTATTWTFTASASLKS